jgi:hypothetical protein
MEDHADVAMRARAIFLDRVRRIVAAASNPQEAAQELLAAIDEGYDPEAADDSPGWALVEIDPTTGEETGRDLTGLAGSISFDRD